MCCLHNPRRETYCTSNRPIRAWGLQPQVFFPTIQATWSILIPTTTSAPATPVKQIACTQGKGTSGLHDAPSNNVDNTPCSLPIRPLVCTCAFFLVSLYDAFPLHFNRGLTHALALGHRVLRILVVLAIWQSTNCIYFRVIAISRPKHSSRHAQLSGPRLTVNLIKLY